MGRPRGRHLWSVAVLVISGAASACGASTPTAPGPSTPSSSFQFATTPIPLTSSFSAVSRGYGATGDMEPEVSFYAGSLFPVSTDVVAPADGLVTSITTVQQAEFFGTITDLKRIDFLSQSGYRFYVTRVRDVTVQSGASVTARQRIGGVYMVFRQGAMAIGLGLIDPLRTVGFARPERYPDDIRLGANALDFFAQSTKAEILGKMTAVGKGTLNYDVPGTLQGLWYREGSPISDSARRENRNSWLFFIHTSNDVGNGMRAIFTHTYPGGADLEIERLAATDPHPMSVTPASGVVKYKFPVVGGGSYTLIVQMLDATTVRIETWDSFHSPDRQDSAFTAAARTYIR